MNVYLIILYGYVLVAGILIYFFYRDQKSKTVFLGRHRIIAWGCIGILGSGILMAFDARFIEINRLVIHEEKITTPDIKKSIRIALIGDLHVGEHKKAAWAQKVVNKIIEAKPDMVVIAGDNVYNHGTSLDETEYLEPLRELPKHFPTYYVMGNHEYGYAAYGLQLAADQSTVVEKKMKDMGLTLLKDQLGCPKINEQRICLFGMDDVYREMNTFDELKKWNKTAPLILVVHNPDGVLLWPDTETQPVVTLAAHTHGGQIWLPIIGPLGHAAMKLGPEYYRGLTEIDGKKLFTTVGVSESGGPIRFLTPPEVAIITLQP